MKPCTYVMSPISDTKYLFEAVKVKTTPQKFINTIIFSGKKICQKAKRNFLTPTGVKK